jgi:hypothetical protein
VFFVSVASKGFSFSIGGNFSRDFAMNPPGKAAKRKCGNTVAAAQKHSFPKGMIVEKAEAVKKKLTGKS